MRGVLRVTDRLSIEVDGTSPEEIFDQLAEVTTVFEDSQCGACKSKDIKYVVRKVGKYTYREMHCKDMKCRARLTFGKSEDTQNLYPRRCETYKTDQGKDKPKGSAVKDENGKTKYLPNNGWTKYVPGEE